MTEAKIFVRKRTKVGEGEQKPRFRGLAVSGLDVQFHVEHVRKQELEQIAEHLGAEIVYLEIDSKMDKDK